MQRVCAANFMIDISELEGSGRKPCRFSKCKMGFSRVHIQVPVNFMIGKKLLLYLNLIIYCTCIIE